MDLSQREVTQLSDADADLQVQLVQLYHLEYQLMKGMFLYGQVNSHCIDVFICPDSLFLRWNGILFFMILVLDASVRWSPEFMIM